MARHGLDAASGQMLGGKDFLSVELVMQEAGKDLVAGGIQVSVNLVIELASLLRRGLQGRTRIQSAYPELARHLEEGVHGMIG